MTATPKAATDRIYLFTYGTLKRGEPGHELMSSGATFVSTVMKTNLRWIREADYPSCIETDDATDFVAGEIWDVPASYLPILNEYEGKNYRLVKLRESNLHAYLLRESDADRFVETT
jgi:gamma-glutamylcyclotransferase (GGCT)/AIG2-like uncharacterized protein YtfP